MLFRDVMAPLSGLKNKAVKMGAIYLFKTLIYVYQTSQHCSLEDNVLQSHVIFHSREKVTLTEAANF
jgi:hypothetical protein